MHITITSLHIDIKNKTRNLIEKKLNKLGKYLDGDQVQVDVELSQESGHHKKGDIYRCEINLQNDGKIYRAEAVEKNIESAFMKCLKEVDHELSDGNTKKNTLLIKGARKIKRILRFE